MWQTCDTPRPSVCSCMWLALLVAALASAPGAAEGPAPAVPAAPSAAPAARPGAPLPKTKAHEAGVVPKPVPPVEKRVLEVRVGTAVIQRWTAEDLNKQAAFPGAHGVGGKSTQFPLKDVLGSMVAPGTRLVAVQITGGPHVTIDEKQWGDAARVPVIWTNRRGLFKLGWIDATGKPLVDSAEMRDVAAIEIVRP